MARKNGKSGVWVANLERFGYNLLTVGKTEKECRQAISEKYIEAYTIRNGNFNLADEEDKNYYDTAMEEVWCRFVEYGEVEWC